MNAVGEVECPTCRREEVSIVRVQKSIRGKLILTYQCKKAHRFDVSVPEQTDCDIRVFGWLWT